MHAVSRGAGANTRREVRNRRGRRRFVALGAAATIVAAGLVAAAGITPAAAATPARDGSSSTLAAPSCWAIKQLSPSSPSGVYWLQTATLVDPEQFYCDQTTDGGGWVLVGRGRDGWNFGPTGQGSVVALRTTPSGTGAFAPATLPTDTIDGLLDGTRVDALTDGVRIVRSTNSTGTVVQEARFNESNRATWSWAVSGGILFSNYIVNGTTTNRSGNTQSFTMDQYNNALVSASASGHNYRMGFGFGSNIRGTNSATTYLWSNTTEGNALPFTQVWLRPKLTSTAFAPIPSGGLGASTVRDMVSDQTSLNTPWGVTGVHGSGELHMPVETFAQIGNVMYVGGDFVNVQKGANPSVNEKVAQPYLAAFNATTGEWISTFRPTLNGIVWDLQALPNGDLAVGGEFTTVNGQSAPALAIVDGTSGLTATDFSASVSLTDATVSAPAQVKAMDLQGNYLYLGGRFNRVSGGVSQPLSNVIVGRVARVSVADGRPDGTWKPNFDGTVVELDASDQGDRVYAVGYFSHVNGASSANEATISTGGNGDLVPGIGHWTPSTGSGTATYQQAIRETNDGYVWQGGSEHILEQFDRASYTMKSSFITKSGGDIQTIGAVNGVVYASCHCNNDIYSGTINYSNPVPSATDVDSINYIGAFDSVTGQYIADWWPSGLDTSQNIGGWELYPDTQGCLWFGGDFSRGSYRDGAYQWLGGFGKFCANDHTAPSVPTGVTTSAAAGGVTVHWAASADDSAGTVTYEVLSGDRVIGTTTATSFVDPNPTYPDTYWVRAMDASGNRSATSPGVTEQGPDTTPPTAPTNLTATAASAAAVQLGWTAATDNVGVTGYQVVRDGTALPGTVSNTTFTDTGVVAGRTYSYSVRAIDAAGNLGPASDPASVTTPTANPVVFSDTFAGADGAAWQSDWTCLSTNGSVTTQSGAGVLAFDDVTGAYSKAQLSGVAAQTDGTLLMSYQWNSSSAAAFFSVYLRGSGGWKDSYRPKNGYGLQLTSNSGTVQVQKAVNGTMTALHSVAGGQAVTTAKQWLRVQVNGTTIQFRTWLNGQAEPSTWKSVDTDGSVTAAGQVFLSINRGGSTNVGAKSVTIDDLQLFDA